MALKRPSNVYSDRSSNAFPAHCHIFIRTRAIIFQSSVIHMGPFKAAKRNG